jgi:hypothetical protein
MPLAPGERDVLASVVAALGIREMGWVLWEAEAPFYFVSSSAPFHAAFRRATASCRARSSARPASS